MKNYLSILILLTTFCLFQSCEKKQVNEKNAIVDARIEYQIIDGFGVLKIVKSFPNLQSDNSLSPIIPERSIFTISTIKTN